SVSLLPGHYYLIQESSGGAAGASLPTPDASGTIAMAAGAGKVALANTTAALTGGCPTGGTIVDLVGYGSTATCFEGGAAAPAPGNTTAAIRNGAGCTDTNVNSADFTAATPTPRNTSSTSNQCTGAIAPPTIVQSRTDWHSVMTRLFAEAVISNRVLIRFF
ncbi:MAG TPA: hypothetical protein VGN86_01185, partial [Pyrinomonadaceae bacterium]|nr:hypothetical protein [Pyrinomonadaceae bacterium]